MTIRSIPSDGLALRRRLLFFGAIALILGATTGTMAFQLAHQGWTVPEVLLLALFVPLMAQLSFGFVLSATGYWILRRGDDPARINHTLPLNARSERLPRTAIVMPIFNEDVARVFQGVRVMLESLRRTGRDADYDFHILSDSNDPTCWIAEETAWLALCDELGAFDRVFYRKRRISLHNKSGNVADFCRRWGNRYRYMVVLDADSIMTGTAIVRLTHLMEAHAEVGIIQTAPRLVLGRTLFQRVIQFTTHLYGPMFAAGSSYWQLGSGNYWGHNAIIRLKPFMQHCAIPELPRGCPLGRRILSHDTVEAAWMRRAGYEVWLAHDLDGSYEEAPPNLQASLVRDRRWCFGNLQHLWLLSRSGLHSANRIHLLNGILAYASAPIWLLLLVASTSLALSGDHGPAETDGPASAVAWARLGLFTAVLGLLFLPKLLGVLGLRNDPVRRARFGGWRRVVQSVFLEIGFSLLLAPILMLFYARFVVSALTGYSVKWGGQKRRSTGASPFRAAIRRHGVHTLVGLIWAGTALWFSPVFFIWLLPVLLGPILSVPFAVFSGSERIGQVARRAGLFLVPDETNPPVELRAVESVPARETPALFEDPALRPHQGLALAALDPRTHAIHLSFLRVRATAPDPIRRYRLELAQTLLTRGPTALSAGQIKTVLWDVDSLGALHRSLWTLPRENMHPSWSRALERFCQRQAAG